MNLIHKKKEPVIRIDCVAGGYLINRYVARCHETIFNNQGTLEENVPIKTRRFYKIQWANIKADIKNYFLLPHKPTLIFGLGVQLLSMLLPKLLIQVSQLQ